MTDAAFRVALVGCGRISRNHVEAIRSASGLELAAVCDLLPDRAREVGEAAGVPWFVSFEDMLATVECDVVTLATPSGLHPEEGIRAAQAGKHVITEKPMAISLEGADALLAACATAGVQLFVVKQNRLNPPIQLLRRALEKGRFGRLYMVTCSVLWSRPQEYYDQASWRGTWALDGGAIMNQASHYVDLLQWVLGPVASVCGMTATLGRRIETEDTGAAVIRGQSGAVGVIQVTMLTYPKNLEGSVTVIGERGTVRIGGTAVNRIEEWAFAEPDDDDAQVERVNTEPPDVYGFGHLGYYRNVVAALRGEASANTDGVEGRKSLELILAIYAAAREGREIRLPLSPGWKPGLAVPRPARSP
ncbi:MAG TPA: Gfo/Idh/MocA family oxidoreductase [Gemmatimonadaceae bacterium]|nr:Gfo/Idh/MocA family oxidoreductase [Gemmatimonadaceae bacterium]